MDPSYQRTGAATALLNWGFDLADKEGVELHLEATRGAFACFRSASRRVKRSRRLTIPCPGAEGLPLYDRWGFTRIAEPIRAIDGSFEVSFASGSGGTKGLACLLP